jgi:protein-tyrosine phosphatase
MEQAPTDPKVALQRRRLSVVLVTAIVGAVVLLAIMARGHVLPKRFAEVEPGLIFRGGYDQPWPLKRLVRDHGIREVLCLLNPVSPEEKRVVEEAGIRLLNVPMPGDGRADFESLDRAADVIAAARDAGRPIFVHCAAGVQRTNAAIVAWRLRHCGWSYDQAIAEAEKYWLDRSDNPELYEHLRKYADQLPSRAAGAASHPVATQHAR